MKILNIGIILYPSTRASAYLNSFEQLNALPQEIIIMKNLPKVGLPVILLAFVLIIFISKSSINIGYGED